MVLTILSHLAIPILAFLFVNQSALATDKIGKIGRCTKQLQKMLEERSADPRMIEILLDLDRRIGRLESERGDRTLRRTPRGTLPAAHPIYLVELLKTMDPEVLKARILAYRKPRNSKRVPNNAPSLSPIINIRDRTGAILRLSWLTGEWGGDATIGEQPLGSLLVGIVNFVGEESKNFDPDLWGTYVGKVVLQRHEEMVYRPIRLGHELHERVETMAKELLGGQPGSTQEVIIASIHLICDAFGAPPADELELVSAEEP